MMSRTVHSGESALLDPDVGGDLTVRFSRRLPRILMVSAILRPPSDRILTPIDLAGTNMVEVGVELNSYTVLVNYPAGEG
jgi:hypothetical protein